MTKLVGPAVTHAYALAALLPGGSPLPILVGSWRMLQRTRPTRYAPIMTAYTWQNTVSRVDRTLGEGLERQVVAHHERRLRNLGCEHALSPGPGLWAEADTPPRPGNSLELLVDGETALPRIAEALTAAR